MTTIVSRLYADAPAANAAVADLRAAGLAASLYDVIGRDGAGSAAARMKAARVGAASAAAYGERIERGNVLLVVRAPLTPFGFARTVMDIVDRHESIRVPGAVPDEYIREEIGSRYYISVLTDHPRFFTQDITPGSLIRRGPVTAAWGMPMLKRYKTRFSAMTGTRHMSRFFWPQRLVSPNRHKNRVLRNWKLTEILGLPTVSRHNGPI